MGPRRVGDLAHTSKIISKGVIQLQQSDQSKRLTASFSEKRVNEGTFGGFDLCGDFSTEWVTW